MDSPAPALGDREGLPAPVDPFLAELLENPRHRLTVLRMELDIQRFMQNPEQHQFEFQHLPTSYLRCAAHRVAQHYGLQTMAIESTVDGLGSKVIARKTPECKYPAICLSEVPAKLPEKEANEQVKIVIRPRPNKASSGDADLGMKKGSLRSVEERKEEYDKARARIFSDRPEIEGSSFVPSADGRTMFLTRDDQDYDTANQEIEKTQTKDGASRVAAIFRDREKDRFDPDYDRSNARFVRGVSPGQNFGMQGCGVFQPTFMPYGGGISQFGHLPANQPSVSYNPSNPPMNMYCAFGGNQNAKDAVYMQWPSPTMMYANSYEHFRHAVFQAPFYQPLSFEHTQNC